MQDSHASIGEQVEALKNELTKETSTREADIFELRERVGGEKLARAEHHSSVQELIAREKAAREAHAQELMANERAARDAHHDNIQEHLQKWQESHHAHRASADERFINLEQLLSASTERHDAMKNHHASIGEEVEALKSELSKETSTR